MKLHRRVFLAGLGGAGLGFGLGGLSHLFPLPSPRVGPEWSPGDEEYIPSTCLLCPSHCGILGRVVDGALVGIEGNPLHPISRGGLCPKGRAGHQLLYHPARLRGAVERSGAPGSTEFRVIEWDTALDSIAQALGNLRQEKRTAAVGYLSGDVGATLGELIERFLRVYGSPHFIRETYDDGAAEVMELAQGRAVQPAFDLERASLVLSFGAPLAEAWWCLPQAAQARDQTPEDRRRWVQIDTRLSRTAAAADEWLPVRPAGYGAVALAIAYVLLKEGLYDSDWVHRGVTGFEDWTDESGRSVPGFRSLVLRHGRPESVAERVGLEVQTIVRIAKQFGRSPRPLAVWDHAVSWRRGGLADALAIHSLNLLTGSILRPGGVYFESSPVLPPLDELSSPPNGTGTRAEPGLKDNSWADAVLDGTAQLEVLFLHHSNPVASAPDSEKVQRALERIPLVVSFSPFLDESARHANLVLPDHTYLERWQDAVAPSTVPSAVWGIVQPIVRPLHDTRATGDVLLELGSRLGGEMTDALAWPNMEQLVRERAQRLAAVRRGSVFVSDFRRSELGELAARGWWIPHGQGPAAFWNRLRETGGWFDPYHDDTGRSATYGHPENRASLLSLEARRRLSGPSGADDRFPPFGGTAEETEQRDAGSFPLQLVPYRVMTLASGTTPLMPWLLESVGPLTGSSWEVWVEINPDTASELDLSEGQKVRVVSAHGEFEARLRLFAGAQPGVVNAPYGLHTKAEGWGSMEPVNPLRAVGSQQDPVTGLPDWYSTHVRLEVA